MNKFFKFAMMALVLLVSACVITSCGKDDDSSTNSDQPQSKDVILGYSVLGSINDEAESELLNYIADKLGGKLGLYIVVPNSSIDKVTAALKPLQSDTKWADDICKKHNVRSITLHITHNTDNIFDYSYSKTVDINPVGNYTAKDSNGGEWKLEYRDQLIEGDKHKAVVTVPEGYKIAAKEYSGYWQNKAGLITFHSDNKIKIESSETEFTVLSFALDPTEKADEFITTIQIRINENGTLKLQTVEELIFKKSK